MNVRLLTLDGGTSIDIVKDLMLVGRKEDCDIFLDHKSISKLHCVIVKTEGLLLIRDLGSTNGTRVNGQRVRRAALLPNDVLNIASLRFRVSFHADEEKVFAPEHTQQIDAKEVARMMQKSNKPNDIESDAEIEGPSVQANILPDVYPDSPPAKK